MAGITEDDNWIRLYPVSYNYFIKKLRFKKFTWIEAKVKKASEKLMRKESYNIKEESIRVVDDSLASIYGSQSKRKEIWEKRKSIIQKYLNGSVTELKDKWNQYKASLGIIKPNLIDLRFRKPIDKIEIKREKLIQKSLNGEKIYVADKIKHEISYLFKCNDPNCTCNETEKKHHDMTCEDWELFEAVRKWSYPPLEKEQKIRYRFFNWMRERDLYFCLGMISKYPQFVIIGLFYPPKKSANPNVIS